MEKYRQKFEYSRNLDLQKYLLRTDNDLYISCLYEMKFYTLVLIGYLFQEFFRQNVYAKYGKLLARDGFPLYILGLRWVELKCTIYLLLVNN